MNPATYGDEIADVYDELYPDAPPAAIESYPHFGRFSCRSHLGLSFPWLS